MEIQDAFYSEKEILSKTIRHANIPVAETFGLTRENAPSHPSFCRPDWICSGMDRGERYFLARLQGAGVGCVAYESPDPEIAYLNRLAVLPSFQNRGIGRQLVSHVVSLARKEGKTDISIGIIQAHEKLKTWYLSLGFLPTRIQRFDHLPFDVLFMNFRLGRSDGEIVRSFR